MTHAAGRRRRRIAIAVAVAAVGVAAAACSGKKAESQAQAQAQAEPAIAVPTVEEPRIPAGPVPVALPAADTAYRRHLGRARVFVVMNVSASVFLGPLGPGPQPYDGVLVDETMTLGSRVATLLGTAAAPDPYGARPWYDPNRYLRLRGAFDVVSPIDVLFLADRNIPARTALMAIDGLEGRVALAVAGIDGPDAFAFRLGVPGSDYVVPAVRLSLRATELSIGEPYGRTRKVSFAAGVVDRTELATAIAANIDTYSGSRLIEIRLMQPVSLQIVIDVLSAAAEAKLTSVMMISEPEDVAADADAAGVVGGLVLGQPIDILTMAIEPKITFDRSPEVSPGYSKSRLAAAVKRYETRLEICYRTALDADPTLTGIVIIEFTVDGDGNVVLPAAFGVDPELADCIEGVFDTMTVPEPKAGTSPSVTYRLTLTVDG